MIDTIILTVPAEDYQILNHQRFQPPTDRIHEAKSSQEKYVNNPTTYDKNEGIYKPRLTVRRRYDAGRVSIPLKIEFSVPKLLFGNNVDELAESDFDAVVRALQRSLLDMDVHVTNEAVRRAGVSAVHIAKNIPLSGGYTAQFVIKELSKINLTRQMDLSKTDFRNEGKSLQYYAVCHSLVFYDKISDLHQSKARAIDKDQTIGQLSLFEELQSARAELLRMEVRLSNRQKMRSVLAALGFVNQPTFSAIFKEGVWQKILRKYWNDFVAEKNLFLFEKMDSPKSILKGIIDTQPTLKPKQAIYLLGLTLAAKECGVRDLRAILDAQGDLRTWQRISRDLKELSSYAKSHELHEYIKDIEECLSRFEPYRLQKAKTADVSFM